MPDMGELERAVDSSASREVPKLRSVARRYKRLPSKSSGLACAGEAVERIALDERTYGAGARGARASRADACGRRPGETGSKVQAGKGLRSS